MNYSIPLNSEEIIALGNLKVSEETVAVAIAGVVQMAIKEGQSLEELKEQVLQEDYILDQVQRLWLSKMITLVWKKLS